MSDTPLPTQSESLGRFLRQSRARLDPPAGAGRRRTPGLRREEVAQRAGVSVTWYTWLEQGRGGPPSEAVLERLAGALELDGRGRELLFLIGRERPPPPRRAPTPEVPVAVKAVLEALTDSPAFVRDPLWNVIAWNPAAHAVLAGSEDPEFIERNILRRMFLGSPSAQGFPEWEEGACYAVGAFRIDLARAGRSPEADALIAELTSASPMFARLWTQADPRGGEPPHLKRLWRPEVGPIAVRAAAFAIEGAPGLTLIVFSPAEEADRRAVRRLLSGREGRSIPPERAPAVALRAG